LTFKQQRKKNIAESATKTTKEADEHNGRIAVKIKQQKRKQ